MSPLPIREVQDLYDEIDRSIAAFKLATGLRCRQDCGQCCPGAQIRVAMVEMLPAAAFLLKAGSIDECLHRLSAAGDTCVGYSPEPLPENGGHCLFYPYRPTVCRLFGFSAMRNRTGILELSTCRPIRQDFPEAVSRAEALLASEESVPLLTGFSQRLFGLEPSAHLMPINHALAQAIERCGLMVALNGQANSEVLPCAS